MQRRMLAIVFVFALVAGTFTAAGATSPPTADTTVSLAVEQPEDIAKTHVRRADVETTGRWVVTFSERPDVREEARRAERADDRPRIVRDALVDAAQRAQAEVLALIEADDSASAESHWVSNAIVVDGSDALIDQIRGMRGVASVQPERLHRIVAPVDRTVLQEDGVIDAPWGILRVRAPEVWDAGILGGGVVVASLDSGVQFDHPALVDSYRGNLGAGAFDHDYNWFDASGDCPDPGIPCDLLGHGTHTMGTMIGGDGPGPFAPDVGVAPEAEWISVSCGPFFCSDSQLMTAAEWFIAPTDVNGANPDPSRAPHVINNSWGGGPGDPFFQDYVEAWAASGIIPVFASGNPGPACGNGGSPGDYLESFSVGATDINDAIADFSGRGPSAFGKINPDVAAPGVDVLSSVPGDAYEFFSGTSMATPHVVGTLALVMSSKPDLIGQVDSATDIIRQTAVDMIDLSCGGDADGDPNNVFGDGIVDAFAAVSVAATGGTLGGTVVDATTGAPIGGATVTATGAFTASATTATDGTYSMLVAAGTYAVTFEAFGYAPETVAAVEIVADAVTTQDGALTALPTVILSGRVRNAEFRGAIAGASVSLVGVPVDPVVTGADGGFAFEVPTGTYTVRAAAGPCLDSAEKTVDANRNVQVTLALVTKLDLFGHACSEVPFEWMEAEHQTGLYGDDFVGRLDLPFSFPFYGEGFERVFVTTNGYLDFVDSFFGFSEFFNSSIPSSSPPNAAVYALWEDLIVDDDSRVDYDEFEVDGQGVFVIEYNDIRRLSSGARADLQIKLWEDGTIDLLFGEGVDGFGNGSAATIGIENSTGTDALQLGFRQAVVEPFSAYRIETVPVGVVAGQVTNANDGSPVSGAAITLVPSERSTTTDSDGNYQIVALPGSYTVQAAASNYEGASRRNVNVRAGRTTTVDFALAAGQVSVSPASIAEGIEFGDSAIATVTVENTGTGQLDWEIREQDLGFDPPIPSPDSLVDAAGDRYQRTTAWESFGLDVGTLGDLVVPGLTFDGPLDRIIDDPIGDGGPVDIVGVDAGADDLEMSMAIELTSDSNLGEIGGFVFLDTDQDATTGLPPEELSGLPTQEVGMEYFLDMFDVSFGNVFVVDAFTFELVGIVDATIDGSTVRFDIPLELLGFDDGEINTAMVLGDFFGPTDWAPDAGFGTIEPGRDAPWMSVDPVSGSLAPGTSTDVIVTLGGPSVQAGNYTGELRVNSSDPVTPRVTIDVSLEVALPAGFAGIGGTVTDADTGEPLPASVVVAAEVGGVPALIEVSAGDDGEYFVTVPEGTWDMGVSFDGYVAESRSVTVAAGDVVTEDFALASAAAEMTISGDFGEFVLPGGEQATGILTISNTGTGPLVWEVFENLISGPTAVQPTTTEGAPYTYGSDGARPELDDHLRSQVTPTSLTAASTLIVEDPAGDGSIGDVIAVFADLDPATLVVTLEFTEASTLEELQGFVGFDLDQDSATGLPPIELGGSPGNDIGMEVFVDLFTFGEDLAFVVDANEFIVLAEVPLEVVGNTITFGVPAEVLGSPQALNMAAWFPGFPDFPQDFVPDEGHATVTAFADIPWLELDATSGEVAPGSEQLVTVTIDTTGLSVGDYFGELVFTSNAPNLPSFPVPIPLTVEPS